MAPISQTHRVVALDLPGFGGSDKPPHASYDFAFYEELLEEFLDALGLWSVDLAAHDLSGPVATHWVLHRPGRVARLALLNTVLYPDPSPEEIKFVMDCLTPGRRDELTSDRGLTQALNLGFADPAGLSPEALEVYCRPFKSDCDRRTLARAGAGLNPTTFRDISTDLHKIGVPMCAVYGDQDRAFPNVATTFARLKRDVPRTQVVPIIGAGHYVQEDNPRQVAELLAQFFAGLPLQTEARPPP